MAFLQFEFDVWLGELHEMMTRHFPMAALRFAELFGATGEPVTTTTTTLAPTTSTSTTSTSLAPSPAPSAPTELRGTAFKNRVDLTWTGSTTR